MDSDSDALEGRYGRLGRLRVSLRGRGEDAGKGHQKARNLVEKSGGVFHMVFHRARSRGVVANCGPAAAGCAIAGRLRGLQRVPDAGGCSCLREGGGGFTGLLRAGMTGA